jgi:putative ABC transport system permease protein
MSPAVAAKLEQFSTELRIAVRNVLRHRTHTALALAAIILGICGLATALGFIEWGGSALREAYIRTQFAHLQITAKGYFEQGQVPVGKLLLPSALPNAQALQADRRVKAVFPRVSFNALASRGELTVGVLGTGVDVAAETRAGMTFDLIEKSASNATGIVVGEGLARYLSLKPGETLTLTATTRTGGVNAIELPITGVFSTGNRTYDDYNIRIPIAQAQKLLRIDGVHRWMVLLHDTEQTSAVQRDMEKWFPPAQFDRVPWTAQADYVVKMAKLYAGFSAFMKVVIAVIIVLGISNTLSMAVMERTAEIGTTLALGENRNRVLRNFIFEGASLAVLGGVLGVLCAIVLAKLVSALGIPMPPPPGMTRAWTVQIWPAPGVLFNTLLVAIPSVLFASLFPAWRAAKLNIVDALRKAK